MLTLSDAISFLNSYPSTLSTYSADLQTQQTTLQSQLATLQTLSSQGASISVLQLQQSLIAATQAAVATLQSNIKTLNNTKTQAQAVVNTSLTGPTGSTSSSPFVGVTGMTGPTGPQGIPGVAPTGPRGPGGNVATLDTTPTSGSTSAVTSSGIYSALQAVSGSTASLPGSFSINSTQGQFVGAGKLYWCVSGPTSALDPLDSDTNLVYYIPFNKGSVVNDAVVGYAGGPFNVKSANSTTLPAIDTSNYKVGSGSLSLVSTYQQYVSLPVTTIPSSSSGFTLSFFFMLPATQPDGTRFLDWGNGSNSNNLTVQNSNGTSGYFTLRFIDVDNGNYKVAQQILLNSWYHVAWVFTSSGWNIFLNGTKFTYTPSGYPSTVPRQYCNLAVRSFTGNIDDFRYYTRALSDTEIVSLSARTTNTIGTWKSTS